MTVALGLHDRCRRNGRRRPRRSAGLAGEQGRRRIVRGRGRAGDDGEAGDDTGVGASGPAVVSKPGCGRVSGDGAADREPPGLKAPGSSRWLGRVRSGRHGFSPGARGAAVVMPGEGAAAAAGSAVAVGDGVGGAAGEGAAAAAVAAGEWRRRGRGGRGWWGGGSCLSRYRDCGRRNDAVRSPPGRVLPAAKRNVTWWRPDGMREQTVPIGGGNSASGPEAAAGRQDLAGPDGPRLGRVRHLPFGCVRSARAIARARPATHASGGRHPDDVRQFPRASHSVARCRRPSRPPPAPPGADRVHWPPQPRRRGAPVRRPHWAVPVRGCVVPAGAILRCGRSGRATTSRASAAPWKAGIRTAALARPALDPQGCKTSRATARTKRNQTNQQAERHDPYKVESETARTRPSRTAQNPPGSTAGPWPRRSRQWVRPRRSPYASNTKRPFAIARPGSPRALLGPSATDGTGRAPAGHR